MELTQLLNSIHAIQVTGEVQRKDVGGIFYDSRRVKANSIFVAIKGYNTDGHKYIMDAVNNGAIAVVIEDADAVPEEILMHTLTARILVKDTRRALAELSHSFYKEPSKKLKLTGITGTNGKTTTSYYIKNILETTGEKVGLLGTIANMVADKVIPSSLTTPESNDLNELLLDMYSQGCTSAVMEVSSHSLVLNRVFALEFMAAVFTNLTVDHLDFHKNLDNYLDAKKILFDSLSESAFAIYNLDDERGSKIVKDTKAKKVSYGKNENADFQITDINFSLDGTNFKIKNNGSIYNVHTSLIGEFNAYNAASAFTACACLGVNIATIIEGIRTTKQVPGRFEVIGTGSKKVIVDYSHTPDSLEKCLQAVNEIVKNEFPVYTVFGCGGNRDKSKRPVMGKIAADNSTKAFVTSDNPRFEEPGDIIKDIVAGIDKKNIEIIEDRKAAIVKAIKSAEDKSVIVIAGKGHEDYQIIKDVKIHFSDKEIAEQCL